MSVESDCVHGVGLCTLVDAIGDHQTSRDKASEIMIHKSTVETDDRQMQGRSYARRRLPSSLRGSVDDIAASKDILGEIITHHCRTFTIAARVQIGIRRCWYHLAAGSRSLRACLYSSASDSLGLSSVGF